MLLNTKLLFYNLKNYKNSVFERFCVSDRLHSKWSHTDDFYHVFIKFELLQW